MQWIVVLHQVTAVPPSISTKNVGPFPSEQAARSWGEAQKLGATFVIAPLIAPTS